MMMRIPRVQTLKKKIHNPLYKRFIRAIHHFIDKINFSKENIIYNTRLHDPLMTRMIFSYPII